MYSTGRQLITLVKVIFPFPEILVCELLDCSHQISLDRRTTQEAQPFLEDSSTPQRVQIPLLEGKTCAATQHHKITCNKQNF